MTKTRRDFLTMAAGCVAVGVWRGTLIAQQAPPPFPLPPGLPNPNDPLGPPPLPKRDPDKELNHNQEEIRKDMARLTQLVEDLQKEFDANSTTKVLSMSAVKKTEDIEKLARDIRNLLKG